ncbi:unnamed protein product [Linum trigynum]|uniref:Uncharacterized protein n=1 Tax=Linum trigynum TaxID=586398 RepID=A0AAV2CIW2_9ROSI
MDFGLGNISDTDDSAVEEITYETQDLCALEQISKITCSGFNNSPLLSNLKTRFRKLKSFPDYSTRPAASASSGVVRSVKVKIIYGYCLTLPVSPSIPTLCSPSSVKLFP